MTLEVTTVEERNRLKLEMYAKAMSARPPQCRGMHLEATIRKLSECPAQPVPPKKVFVNVDESDDSITYGADFQLPDDGTPGDGRFLQVRVEVPDKGGNVEVRLSVREQGGKVQPVGSFETADLACIANLLYPVAGIQTTHRIVQRM